jgi:hypothetical protein
MGRGLAARPALSPAASAGNDTRICYRTSFRNAQQVAHSDCLYKRIDGPRSIDQCLTRRDGIGASHSQGPGEIPGGYPGADSPNNNTQRLSCANRATCLVVNMTFDFSSYGRQWFADGTAARRDIMAGHRCGSCAYPRSNRLFDHRRGRSSGRPSRVRGYCDDHCADRRAARDDLSRDRRRRRAGRAARARSWRRVFVCRYDTDGTYSDRRRAAPARSSYAKATALLIVQPGTYYPAVYLWSTGRKLPPMR